MRRFSFKKLFLIVFVFLFVLIGFSFFARSSNDAPEAPIETASAGPVSVTAEPVPVENAEVSEAVQPDVPAVTPVPTEVPELTVTEEFVIELEETESVGGF